MKKFFLILSLFIFTSYLLLPAVTHAQLYLGTGTTQSRLATELVVNVNPEHPRPLETVSISLEMYTEDLDSANISYSINGKLVKTGKGLKDFSFTMGGVGKTTNLDVKVDLLNGSSFTKSVSLTPAGVDILWEADSYVPPFYKGKALFAPQGRAKLVAVPYFGSASNSTNSGSNLIYTWKIDGEVEQSLSGYGKNVAYINGSLLGKPTLIELSVSDPVTNTTADNSMTLTPSDPLILFYEDHPLYGITFEKAITSELDMMNDEVNIIAMPFNTSKSDIINDQFNWEINGVPATDISGREAIFRKPDQVGGQSQVSLEVTNPIEYLQLGDAKFMIKFDKPNAITQ